ncbi:MAG TPA: hypothetical protein VGO62_21860, partial [Myxococcota bacterium]
MLGGDLQGTTSARVHDTASSFQSSATITSTSAALIGLVVEDALPASAALVVDLTSGDGSVIHSPAFAAQAPTPLDVSSRGKAEQGSAFTLVVDGVALNAAHLVSLRAVPLDQESGASIDLPIAFAAETVASAQVPADALGRGGWTISLVYDDGTVVPVDLLEVGGACPGSALCATCGDGIRDPGEQCDGSDFAGASCASLGFTGGTLLCTGCQLDATTCTQCGNGVVESGEQCDGAQLGGATCASVGFANPSSGAPVCSAQCQVSAGSCAHCGDGVCSASETHASCAADCTASCGDGACNAGETCSTCPRDCNTCAPYHLVLTASSQGQSGPITGTLPQLITVALLDENDAPVPNAPVTFAPPLGDAMSSAVVVTDGQGKASSAWTLGAKVGAHALTINATPPDGSAVQNAPLAVNATAADVATGTIITLAGDGATGAGTTTFGPGGAGVHSHLALTRSIAALPSGDLVVLLLQSCEIVKLHFPEGVLTRLVGNGGCNGASTPSPDELDASDPALKLRQPRDIAVGPDGAIYFDEDFAEPVSDLVRRIDPITNIVHIVAGSGVAGNNTAPFGDGQPATVANFDTISGIGFSPGGDLVISDNGLNRNSIRRAANNGDGTFGLVASIAIPLPLQLNNNSSSSLVLGPFGAPHIISEAPLAFIAPIGANSTGFNNGSFAVCSASACFLDNPGQVPTSLSTLDATGTGLWFAADSAGHVIRRYDGLGNSTVIAGTGSAGFAGDFGPATSAQLQAPTSAVPLANGDVVFVDARNTIRLIRGGALGSNVVSLTASSGDNQSVLIMAGTQSPAVAHLTANGVGAQNIPLTATAPVGGSATVGFTDAGGFGG